MSCHSTVEIVSGCDIEILRLWPFTANNHPQIIAFLSLEMDMNRSIFHGFTWGHWRAINIWLTSFPCCLFWFLWNTFHLDIFIIINTSYSLVISINIIGGNIYPIMVNQFCFIIVTCMHNLRYSLIMVTYFITNDRHVVVLDRSSK